MAKVGGAKCPEYPHHHHHQDLNTTPSFSIPPHKPGGESMHFPKRPPVPSPNKPMLSQTQRQRDLLFLLLPHRISCTRRIPILIFHHSSLSPSFPSTFPLYLLPRFSDACQGLGSRTLSAKEELLPVAP